MVYTNDITNPIYKFEFERTSTSEYLYNVKVTYSNKPEATTVDFDLSNGYLSINGQIVSIGIRPESASKAYPGDDLILQFGVGNQCAEVISAEKDYVAVTDPATRWGCNEWNRELKNFDVTAAVFTGLNDLPAGDGTQVILLQEFTPMRTIGGTMKKPDSNNYIRGSMAYSYPVHYYEKGEGDSGSQDSPFDYVKKLLFQRQQMNLWYSGSDSSTARNSTANTVFDENNWKSFRAPLNSWFRYEYTASNKTSTRLNGQNFNVIFVPGYGLKLYTYPFGADAFSQDVSVNGDSSNNGVRTYPKTSKDGAVEHVVNIVTTRGDGYDDDRYVSFDANCFKASTDNDEAISWTLNSKYWCVRRLYGKD